MNALVGIGIFSSFIHCLTCDFKFLIIYFTLIALYSVFMIKSRVGRDNGKRKTLMIATWNGKNFRIFYLSLLYRGL